MRFGQVYRRPPRNLSERVRESALAGTTWLVLRAGLGIPIFQNCSTRFGAASPSRFSPLSLRYAPGTLGESERTLPWAVIGLVSGRPLEDRTSVTVL